MSDNDNLFGILGSLRSGEDTLDGLRRKRAITDSILETDANARNKREQELSGMYWYDQETGNFRDDPDNTDRIDAREAAWDLGAADTVRGLSGAWNRKSFLDKTQAMLSLARTVQGIDNAATLDELHKSSFTEYSESGWVQAARGTVGAITLGTLGMTRDTKDFMEESKKAIAATTPANLQGDQFSAEKFVEAVRAGNPATGLAMDEFGITAESLKGVQNYEDAVQALSMKLWTAGREQRASQQQLTSFETGLNFFSNLGDMILQDPDFAAEIGLEVGGIIGVGFLTGGAGSVAWLAARFARTAHKATKYAGRAAKALKLARMERRTRRWERAAEIAGKVNQYKPGMSTFGNLFEALARSGKFNTFASQNGAFLVGQMLDGFVGGAGARYRTNVFMNEEAMALYGDQAELVPNTDRMMIDGVMGAAFSSVLGFGFRFGGRAFLNQFRTDKLRIGFDDFADEKLKNAKTENEKLAALYGRDGVVGVKAFQAARTLKNQAALELSIIQGRDIVESDLRDVRALIGNLNEGVPTALFVKALRGIGKSMASEEQGAPLSTEAVAYRLLHQKDFIEGVENHSLYTPEKADTQLNLQRAHLAHLLNRSGSDPELEARLAEAQRTGQSPDEVRAELKRERRETAEAEKQRILDEWQAKEADRTERALAAARAEEKRLAEEAEAKEAEAKRLAEEAEAARKAKEEADRLAVEEGREVEVGTQELKDRIKVKKKVRQDKLDSDDKVASQEEIDELNTEIEELETKLEERASSDESESPADRAAEAQQAADKAAKDAEAALGEFAEFDADSYASTVEVVDAAASATQTRRVEALDAYIKKVDEDPEGAGGLDDTGLTDVFESKKSDTLTRNQRLDRMLSDAEKPDGPTYTNATVRQVIDAEHEGPDDGVVSFAQLKEIIENKKKKNEEEAGLITDEDLYLHEQLELQGRKGEFELIRQSRVVESEALHQAWLAGGRGEFHGDPSTFRAPEMRNSRAAESATLDARRDADWRKDPEVTGLLEERKSLSTEVAELRKSDADQRDTPALLKEEPTVLTKEELDDLIAIEDKNLSDLRIGRLNDRAKKLEVPGRSKYKTAKDIDKLRRLIAEHKVKAEVARQAEAQAARIKEANTPKGARIDEAQARIDEINSTLAKKGYYDRDADYRSLEMAEAGVTALMRKPARGSKDGDIGTMTYDSLAAVFADTPTLKDLDLMAVFGEAATEGKAVSRRTADKDITDVSTVRFSIDKVLNIIAQRKDAAVPVARSADDLLTPQQLRLRQAEDVANWRAKNAAKRASESKTGWAGDKKDAGDWEKEFYVQLQKILKAESKSPEWKKWSQEKLIEYVEESLMVYSGMKSVTELGDGTADFVTPRTAARAMADVMFDRPDGRKSHSIETEEINEVTGAVETKQTNTDFLEHISHVQPATDREIARILQKMEYDARMEAIARLDFDGPGKPSLDQVIAFITNAKMRQDDRDPLNRETFQTRAFWIPPELRTNLDRAGETLEQRIERATDELLDKDFTAYDILHDDFKTRAGDWGVAVDAVDMNFFRNHGVAGGFPVASAMPGEDGYSFGMAVLDAHMLLHPQTWLDTISAQQRGADLKAERDGLEAKAKDGTLTPEEKERLNVLRSGDSVTSIDGSQNGVRHAHAMSMINTKDDINDVLKAIADAKEASEFKGDDPKLGGVGRQRDFYKDLAIVTSRFLAKSDDPRAKVWAPLELVGGGKELNDYGEVGKEARSFAKKPVMVIPYGAGKRAIANSIRDGLKDLPEPDRLAFEQRAAEAGGVESAIEFLADKWYGNQQKKVAGLIEEALSLPDATKQLEALLRDKVRKDPFHNMLDEADPATQLKMLVERADDIAQRTGRDKDDEGRDVILKALMIEARARAITRAEDIPPEAAALLARRHMAKEMNMVQQAIENEASGMPPEQAWADVVAAGEKGEMGFMELTLMAVQRSEFVQSDSAQARATADHTGQLDQVFELPDEAEGSMFFQQLMDWRTRMVTPTQQEASMKGRKSQRSTMDLHQILEESENLVFKNKAEDAEELAKADLHLVHDNEMTPDEWFEKHIDAERTIASGVIGLRGIERTDRPLYLKDKSGNRRRASKRLQLESKAYNLTGDELQAELSKMRIDTEGKTATEIKQALYEAYIEREKLRIKKLAVKSALAEAAPEFAPPVRLDENGDVAQMERLTPEQKMDRWERHSEDIRNSSSRAREVYDRADEEGKAAYRKAYGLPHKAIFSEDGSYVDPETVIPRKTDKEKRGFEDIENPKPATAKTMGGMLGRRPIHPTESTDMSLGVPALRVLHSNRHMGQKYVGGTLERVQIKGEKNGLKAVRRIQDGGDLFDSNERHRVHTFDVEDLPIVNRDAVLFDPSLTGRMSEEARDSMIETSLLRHAASHGLEDLVEAGKWGEIYAHRVWTQNVKEYGKELKRIESSSLKGEELEAARKKLATKWQKITEETIQKFEEAVDAEWDSKQLDPFDNMPIIDASTPTAEGTAMTRRQALIHSSRLNRDGSRRSESKAAQKTNIDLIAGESIDGMRHATSEMPDAIESPGTMGAGGALPIRSRQSNLITTDPKTGKARTGQGFSRSNTQDMGSGEVVDFTDLDDNAIVKVHFTHAGDRGGAMTSVGLREDISLLSGLGATHGGQMKWADAKAMSDRLKEDPGLVGGWQGTIRFFTMDGIEVVDGHMKGHNVRRNSSRNEAHWILMNSANRFIGDRLSVSALVRQPVRRQRSTWEMMDDRLRTNKKQATALANESQLMIGWLKRKDPDAIATSSFLGGVMDLERYWSNPEFRERVYRSAHDSELARARELLGIGGKRKDGESIEAYNARVTSELTGAPLHGPEKTNIANLLKTTEGDEIPLVTRKKNGKTVYGLKDMTKRGFRTSLTEDGTIKYGVQKGADNPIVTKYLEEIGAGDTITREQAQELISRLEADEAQGFDPAADVIADAVRRGEIGENGSAFTPEEGKLARELAGLIAITGMEDFVFSREAVKQLFPRLAEDGKTFKVANVIAMANRAIQHNRKTRKLIDLGHRDGITGYGRIPHILRLASDGEIDLNNITQDDLVRLNKSWKDHEVGGYDRGADELDEGQLAVMRAEVVRAKAILDSVETDPFTGASVSVYKGDFVDQNGVQRSPAYFMEASNYEMLSPAHQRFNGFLENLLESGTLDLTQVRMLRAATAQLDKSILEGLSLKELSDPEFRAHARELGLGDAKKARARGLSYSKGGFGIALLKGRVGRDIDAVDVVLHEVGHTAMARMIRDGGPEMDEIRGLTRSEEGRKAMRGMVTQMFGGKWTQEAQKQFNYFIKDPDEFVAAWFSYTMMSRSLSDAATIEAAYQKSGSLGQALSNIIRKIAAYAYKRISGLSRVMDDMDPMYRAKMNSLMDHLTGKTDMVPADNPRQMASYYSDAADGMADTIRDWEMEVEALKAQGLEDSHPAMIAAKKDLQDAIDEALENTQPAHLNGDGPGPMTLREFLHKKMEEEYTDTEGVIDFGRMVQEDPIAAEQFIAVHLLPKLQEGRYAGVSSVSRDMAANRELTSGQRVSARTKIDNFILSPANAAHTVNSTVQLQVGDTRYSLMQLLSELVDNQGMLTQGRLNGNQFNTLTSIARALESELVRPFAMLDDELRLAVSKAEGHTRGRVRSLAATDEDLQKRLKHLRELAGKLNLPKDSALRKSAEAELDTLVPEIAEVVVKMQKQFAKGSGLIKSNAVRSGLISGDRASKSGVVPLRLRTESMVDKTKSGGFGERLTKAYEKSMLESHFFDIDTLVGSGILPVPSRSLTRDSLYSHLADQAAAGNIDPKALEGLKSSNKLDELVDLLHKGKAAEVGDFARLLTEDGHNLYKDGVSLGKWTDEGAKYINSRYEAEIEKSGSKDRKVYYRQTDSGAELRQLRLGRRAGSTSYYFGGDSFLSLSNVIDDLGDLFDFDVRIGAAALQRGVGLETMDSANMSRNLDGVNVRGLSVKNLLKLGEKMSQRNTDSHTKTTMENGLRQLRAAYERLGGGLPTVDRTGKIVEDTLARNAASVAMLSYGGNLGVAMLAETAVTALADIAPRAIVSPVKTMTMVWRSMTESMSPIRKTQVARQILFAMHVSKDSVSLRSVDRSVDDLAVPQKDNFFTRRLHEAANITSKVTGAQMIQSFNKGFGAAGAMDDLLSHMDAAVELRRLMDEAGGVTDEKQFRELAKKAGFGRNWSLALAMQDHGLLDVDAISALRDFADGSDAHTSRILDLDAWSDSNAKKAVRRQDVTASDKSLQNVRSFIEDRIARNNVEPRVLDNRLTDNTGWNKMMDVFLSWPRAFYAQKSFVRGGNAFQGGVGHLAAFYAGQAVWDAMYTTIQELARGEDPDRILHEVEADPAGWWMQKVSRTPILGAWSSGLELMVDVARNKAAQLEAPGFGYHTTNYGDTNIGSSPAIAALNQMIKTTKASAEFLYGSTFGGTNSFTADDPKAMQVLNGWLDLVPVANTLPAKVMREMFAPEKDERGRVKNRKGRFYYDALQQRRHWQHKKRQIINQYR